MKLEIQILGVGGGVSKVLHNEPSTAWVLLVDGQPSMLFDMGLGVTVEYTKHFGNLPHKVYISHNHSDHSGELPVVLAVQKANDVPVELYSSPVVLDRLVSHRLHELLSTGRAATDFFIAKTIAEASLANVGHDISLKTLQSKHSETCYGVMLYLHDEPLIGWSADSGYDSALYDELFTARHVILDARVNGSAEHADFNEIQAYIDSHDVQDKNIIILGYGNQSINSNSYTVGIPSEKYVVFDDMANH